MRRAWVVLHFQLWPAPLYHTFPNYLLNGNIKCQLWFCLQLLSKAFLIPRITQRDIINEHTRRSSCRVAVILVTFNETSFFYTNFQKILKYKISRKPVQLEQNCSMRTERWTWRSQQSLFAVLWKRQKTKKRYTKTPCIRLCAVHKGELHYYYYYYY
jgi:hypothetical protein